MLVSYKWLKQLVPELYVTSRDLEEKMSTTGIEVEGVTSPAEGLSKLVVGEILSFVDIPETHLHVCHINIGKDDILQIVCGAPNVKVGNKAIVALVGARIKDNVKIKKGKMRGFESQGMLCSLDEIGVPDDINPMKHEDGIYVMPESAKVGDSIFPYLDMDDEIIELSITPNRADALSMRGVAYEVGAIYDLPVQFDTLKLKEISKAASDVVKVSVLTDKVPTYKIRIIENVKIAPSPIWLQNRLMNAGIRPINNVVDVTNYVLMYYGQPLHSFDFDKFGNNEIVVRQAKNDEKLKTLDGVERELSIDDIVITSNGKPVALGGVMGGLDSEITNKSMTVALESALFDSTSIRKTSQKFSLHSEASNRFEKGVNEETVREALDFAAAMISELSGGEVLSGIVESNDYQPKSVTVDITLDKINGALGTSLSVDEVTKIFYQLGFGVSLIDVNTFTVDIPSRRWDITIEADLVEEVARIYGYDKLPSTLPEGNTAGELTTVQQLKRRIRTNLESSGLSEIISYSLTTSKKATEFSNLNVPQTGVMLPMTEDHSILRMSIIPGLLDCIHYNQNRKNADIMIYEVGNIFISNDTERPTEVPNVAFAISGNVAKKTYNQKATPVDFYYAKGIVENLLVNYNAVHFEANSNISTMHPGRTANIFIGSTIVGFVGQIHPTMAKIYDISETYVATLDMNTLLELAPVQTIFTEVPKFPAVTRDIALLVNVETTHAEILDIINASHVKTLVKTELFDVYKGKNLPIGKKSMAYSLTFQNKEKTMTDDEITAALKKIITHLIEKISAEVR